MASGFGGQSSGGRCQDVGCRGGISDQVATYRVEENQDLCENCASTKVKAVKASLGDRADWFCDLHHKQIDYYCCSDEAPLCQVCAFVSHQKPCTVKDINEIVRIKRSMVEGLVSRVQVRLQDMSEKEDMIRENLLDIGSHLSSVKEEMTRTFLSEERRISKEEQERAERIRREAAEEIRKIEERRDLQLLESQKGADEQRAAIKSRRLDLERTICDIEVVVGQKIGQTTNRIRQTVDSLCDGQKLLEDSLLSNQNLIKKGEEVKARIEKTCRSDADVDIVKGLVCTVRKLRYEEIERDSLGPKGNISLPEKSWTLIDRISIPPEVSKPYFIGSADDEKMVISDVKRRTLHTINIRTKEVKKVLQSNEEKTIVSCSPLEKDVILCGNHCKGTTGVTFDGISLYNRSTWEHIRDIQMPKQSLRPNSFVCVHKDNADRILAAEMCQSNVHIVSPSDGKILGIIDVEGKVVQWIRVLSSGQVVVKTGNGEFSVFDPTSPHGAKSTTISNPEWDGCLCAIDPQTNGIYVVYRDVKRRVYTVDQANADGTIEARRIVEYPISERRDVVLPCVMTSSGRLVTCNGESVFVFKQLTLDFLKTF
ncbi:uncharacterized protein [Diadema antillarum]|uniref:uncharacterized protein n=1 Tax=Diadema antillarum TaxID=105358 RepID=UPI003A8A0FFD